MAEPGSLGGTKPGSKVTVLPTVTKTPSTYNSYSPPINFTSYSSPNAPRTTSSPGTITSTREGDYIVQRRNGVVVKRTYSPRSTGAASSAAQARVTQAGGSPGTMPQINGTTSGASATGGGSGGSGGSGSGGSGGAPVIGSPSGGSAGAPDVGNQYGYTANLSPNDVMAGIQYTPRILNQVLGQQASPQTQGVMNPWMDMASNPWAMYLMNSGNAGTGYEDAPTQSDAYNFIAQMLQNAMTPGAGIPDFGSVLGNLATVLQNPDSPGYGSIFGPSLDASGLDAPGSIMRAVAEALSGFGMTMNPLAASNLGNSMGLWQNDYLNNFNMNDLESNPNAAAYLLRRLGLANANIPNPTASNTSWMNNAGTSGMSSTGF